MPRYATILATGSYLPEIEITNAKLRQRFPTLRTRLTSAGEIVQSEVQSENH